MLKGGLSQFGANAEVCSSQYGYALYWRLELPPCKWGDFAIKILSIETGYSGFPNCHPQLKCEVNNGRVFILLSPSLIFSLLLSASFIFSRSRRFYSGNNQSSLSGSLQATCHCTLLYTKIHISKQSQVCVCVFAYLSVAYFCMFVFSWFVFGAHLCGAECGAKRRLGCVDINGFTMECVKAWELVAAKLHSPVHSGGTALSPKGIALHCTGVLYHRNGAKHQRKELPTPASTSTLVLSKVFALRRKCNKYSIWSQV